MSTRYEIIRDALHDTIATRVPSLALVISYEPTSVQAWPMVYTLLDRFERKQTGQIIEMRYRILHRVVVAWQDNEQAERQLVTFANLIPDAIDADPQLGGAITGGIARVVDGEAVFVVIANIKYRALDIFVEVVDKQIAVRS